MYFIPIDAIQDGVGIDKTNIKKTYTEVHEPFSV